MLARLGNVARVDGDCNPVLELLPTVRKVISHPVKLLLEVLSETALAAVAEQCHLGKILTFRHAQEKN